MGNYLGLHIASGLESRLGVGLLRGRFGLRLRKLEAWICGFVEGGCRVGVGRFREAPVPLSQLQIKSHGKEGVFLCANTLSGVARVTMAHELPAISCTVGPY